MSKKEDVVLELQDISKSFYGSYALDNVSFNVKQGEVHILCGENGAGKSTLMKILAGVYKKDKGRVFIKGKEAVIESPKDSQMNGLSIVFQELSLSPTITVAENLFLNRELGTWFVDKKKTHKKAKEILDRVGLKCQPDDMLSSLSIGEMQLVQIAKALSVNANIIIMDEPVSSITEEDTETLFKLINRLKKQGISIIYIDHRIENYKKIGDRVTILRDGKMIETLDVQSATKEDIVKRMVGREVNDLYPKTSIPSQEIKFKCENVSDDYIKNVNLEIKKGEVFGLAGLGGAGRSEILRLIFGANRMKTGKIFIDNKEVSVKSPRDTIKFGMGYIPEDRKLQSLVLFRPVSFNMSLAFMNYFSKGVFLSQKKEKRTVEQEIKRLNIRMLNRDSSIVELSGGNQQKVILSKWLINEKLDILLLDEPTRGVDVGVKHEFYKIIDELANNGITVILITSELTELMGLCDRIAVVNEGRISGVLAREEFNQEKIMHLSLN